MLVVEQGAGPTGLPDYEYALLDGSNLVTLALGTQPTSNQVFAMEIDCGSSQADLVVFDKSNSNITTIATSEITTVKQQGLRSTFVNEERFVAHFTVIAQNNLAPGGFLTIAGRLHLDTNGCPHAVLISLDKDPYDGIFSDKDVTDTDQDAKIKDQLRAGQAHFVGLLNVIDSASHTNAWLVPLGHMTFRHQLDQFTEIF